MKVTPDDLAFHVSKTIRGIFWASSNLYMAYHIPQRTLNNISISPEAIVIKKAAITSEILRELT